MEGGADEVGEEAAAREVGDPAGREVVEGGTEEGADRVVTEEGGEEDRDRRQVRHGLGRGRRDAVRFEPARQRVGERARESEHHQGEEDPDPEQAAGRP